MRIKETSSQRDLQKQLKKPSSPTSSAASLFSAELQVRSTEISGYEEELAELRKEIETAGDLLEKEPNLKNFKEFRDLLSKLAKRINGEAYRLEKVGGTALNPRRYEIITVINSEADKLYRLIVQEHRDRMAITAKVIGIKGLVVDLMT